MTETDKVALTVAAVAARGSGRFALDCVEVGPTGDAAATDGRRMLAIQGPEGVEGEDAGLVPAKLALKASKGRGKTPRVAVGPVVTYCTPDGEITAANPGMSGERFPVWQDMLPADEGQELGCFNAALLGETLTVIGKALKALRAEGGLVKLVSHGPEQPLEMRAESLGRSIIGILAPARSREVYAARRDWNVKKD